MLLSWAGMVIFQTKGWGGREGMEKGKRKHNDDAGIPRGSQPMQGNKLVAHTRGACGMADPRVDLLHGKDTKPG